MLNLNGPYNFNIPSTQLTNIFQRDGNSVWTRTSVSLEDDDLYHTISKRIKSRPRNGVKVFFAGSMPYLFCIGSK